MTSRRKFILVGLGMVLAVFAVPVVWSAFSSHAYFCQGRCIGAMSENWRRAPRVYNIWRVWAAKLYERLPDLRWEDFWPADRK